MFNKILNNRYKIYNKYSIFEITNFHTQQNFSINLSDIINKKHDGIILRNWINENTLLDVLSKINDFPDPFPSPFGSVLGYPLNGAQTPDLTTYLSHVYKTEKLFSNIWGFDLKNKLRDTFQKLSPNYNVKLAQQKENDYIYGTFRIMNPGKGALKAHTGNEFYEFNKDLGMHHLDQIAKILDSMSYFILLQNPTKGGELVLFDLNWHSTPQHFFGFDSGLRSDKDFEKIKRQDVILNPGDLIIFRGGDIWHKIMPNEGNKDRVTFGGWIAPSKISKEYYFWA
tara:strand:- start:5802 stop:6650 length:849 start_codon:yes stop_codon:yes gene_type:complete